MKTLILVSMLFSSLAWSVPETDLPEVWDSKIAPFFQNMHHGTFKNEQGLTISYAFTKSNHAKTLVISPGRTEPALKYAELIYDLKNSFNIFIIDHQGQGSSSRMLSDTHKGHVVEFSHYVADFHQFIETVVKPNTTKPIFLIAHSMGGAIATRYMNQHPNTFNKAVLVAPMMEMNTSPYSEAVACLYANFLVLTKKGSTYAPGYGPYKPEEDTFEKNVYTHSPERFEVTKNLFVNYPDLIVGGPTARWVRESLEATKKIDKLKVTTEILMFQAGIDHIVKPSRQDSFCEKHACEKILVPEAFHEILMEKDAVRDDVLASIEEFFGM